MINGKPAPELDAAIPSSQYNQLPSYNYAKLQMPSNPTDTLTKQQKKAALKKQYGGNSNAFSNFMNTYSGVASDVVNAVVPQDNSNLTAGNRIAGGVLSTASKIPGPAGWIASGLNAALNITNAFGPKAPTLNKDDTLLAQQGSSYGDITSKITKAAGDSGKSIGLIFSNTKAANRVREANGLQTRMGVINNAAQDSFDAANASPYNTLSPNYPENAAGVYNISYGKSGIKFSNNVDWAKKASRLSSKRRVSPIEKETTATSSDKFMSTDSMYNGFGMNGGEWSDDPIDGKTFVMSKDLETQYGNDMNNYIDSFKKSYKHANLLASDGTPIYSEKYGVGLSPEERLAYMQSGGEFSTYTPSKDRVQLLLTQVNKQNPNWVKRLYDKDPLVITKDGINMKKSQLKYGTDYGTHELSYADDNDNWIVFPNIRQSGNVLYRFKNDMKSALRTAIDNKDVVYLPKKDFTENDINWFTTNNYKKYFPATENLIMHKEGGNIIWAKKVLSNKLKMLKSGGTFNVIPEGALHKNRHHLEDVDDKFKDVTTKGIPVVTEGKGGEVEQQAEVEKEEIIFSLDVTKQLEELKNKGTNESAIKAGKLLVHEILENTVDNSGIMNKIE